MSNYFRWNAGRKRQGTPTLESQPGAHTGATRKYIPGYSSSNIVYLDTAAGNDAWTGANPTNSPAGTGPFLTYAAAATAASTTKKIRLVNSATLTSNITKPTEATIGTTSTIQSSSLTAPLETFGNSASTTASRNLYSVTWADKLSKFIAVGLAGGSSSYFAYSSNGTTWSDSSSTTSNRGFYSVAYSDKLGLAVAVGYGSGTSKTAYSTDGITWADNSETLNGSLLGVTWDHVNSLFVAVGEYGDSLITYSSTDGLTWTLGVNAVGKKWATDICRDDSLSLYIAAGRDATTSGSAFFYSSDGITWSASASTTASRRLYAVASHNGLIVAVGETDASASYFAYSTDGITWADSATTDANISIRSVAYIKELGRFVACGNSSATATVYYYSTDGVTWTLSAATTASRQVYGAAYSPLLGLAVAVGNTSTGASYFSYSTAYATTISAVVAGFSIQAVQYSGTVTAYNCTLKQPGTTAALSLDACRVTESGSHVSNNAVTAIGTLVEGDIHYTGVYAAANALDLNLNTIDGTLYIYNGSTTNYERIRDNIIENGVRTSYPVTVTSGNTRGTSSDGTIFGQFCTTSDPLFVDETDYKLQRVLDGYQYDSPMVAASQYYYNQATTQTFRDNGAWSYNEGSATYKYQRTFDFLMPATAIGSAIDFVRHNRANLHVAEDGTPDAVNTPDSRWEEIVMQFKTLPADHIDFINWLEGQVDMTCDISLSPSLTPTTAVTASGATAAGEAVITITDNSGLDSGDQLTIDGNTYTVLYTYGTTKVVLDRITTTALSDTESITVKYDTGFGEYQYVPMLERRLSRWYETDENYMRGLQIRFARKLP